MTVWNIKRNKIFWKNEFRLGLLGSRPTSGYTFASVMKSQINWILLHTSLWKWLEEWFIFSKRLCLLSTWRFFVDIFSYLWCVLIFFLFFHFYCPVLGTGGGKTYRDNPSPFLCQLLIHVYKMFMQTTDIHCPKAMGAHPTDTKRSTKIPGQKK